MNSRLKTVSGFTVLCVVNATSSVLYAEPLVIGLNWSAYGTLDPSKDSVLYRHTDVSHQPFLTFNINSFDPKETYAPWRNLDLVNATGVEKPSLVLTTLDFDIANPEGKELDQVQKSIILETLDISDLSLEGKSVRFRFLGDNNRISLNNADIRLDFPPEFSSSAPLHIDFQGGDSTIADWKRIPGQGGQNAGSIGYKITAPTTVTVAPGAVGTFSGLGDIERQSDPQNAFRFSGPTSIDVDGGTLNFEDSFVVQERGTTTIRNGGALNIQGALNYVTLREINVLEGSTLSVTSPGDGSLEALSLNLSNGTVRATPGIIRIGEVTIEDAGSFVGTGVGANFEIGGLLLNNDTPVDVGLDNISSMKVDAIFSNENATFNLTNSFLTIPADAGFVPSIKGSTFNLEGRSAARFLFPINTSDFYGNFIVGSESSLVFGDDVDFRLGPSVNTLFAPGSKVILSGGTLTGSGDLQDADIRFETGTGGTTALLSPGYDRSNQISDRIGRIEANGDVVFISEIEVDSPDLLNLGIFDGSVYVADLQITGGATRNDELVYGAGTVNLSQLDHVLVRAIDNPVATDFLGQEFTIISAESSLSTGGIFYNGQILDVVEDPSIPALVDFTVADRRTNGNDDVTLVAVVQDVSSLTEHKSVKTDNAKSLVKAITSPTSGGGILTSGATVSTALSSLTNSQLAQVATIHAEPYSSFTTVGLERFHLLAGGVMDHAVGAGEFSGILRPNGEVREGRFWGQLTRVDGDVNGRDDLGNFGYQLGQVIVGMDALGGADRNLGFYLSMGSSSMDEHDIVDQELESEDVGLGVYGHRLLEGGWQVTGAFGIGFGKVESKRTMPVSIGSFTGGVASADYDTTSIYAAARVHRAFELGTTGGWVAYPSLGITYARTRSENIRESGGGDFNYRIAPATADSLVISPGLDLSRPFNINSRPAALGLSVRYEYDPIADSTSAHEINVSSPLFGSFNQVGQNRGPHSVVVGLNSAMSLADGVQLGAGYEYSKHDHGEEHGLGINLTATW